MVRDDYELQSLDEHATDTMVPVEAPSLPPKDEFLRSPISQPLAPAPPLTRRQKRNVALLLLLYLLQGVPMGLVQGSIPYLLRPHSTYAELAVFSLASYPYSLKVLWSPIVDTFYFRKFGRRKTWIVPCILLISLAMFLLSFCVEDWIEHSSEHIHAFTFWSFMLVFLCATQDIAVDGWSLNMLEPEQINYASTAQSVGLNTGFFLSFTVLLVLMSPVSSKLLPTIAKPNVGLVTLSGYLRFWSVVAFVASILVCVVDEQASVTIEDVRSIWASIFRVFSIKNMRHYSVFLLLCKLGFVANETLTFLKLSEKGLSNALLSIIILIDFPISLALGVYIGRASQHRPLSKWLLGYRLRIFANAFNVLLMFLLTHTTINVYSFFVILFCYLFSSSVGTIQFVAIGVFHSQISDPFIGGTYMTILNTLSNLGGTWPKYMLLKAANAMTVSFCSVSSELSCATDDSKAQCVAQGGTCIMRSDGYYSISVVGILTATILLYTVILPILRKLEKAPRSSWAVAPTSANV
ncbi:acetyl-CoA transporter [Schizosaccharomyces japonicus yFS275]|uniref:Acetyl-CoA transporter n=1 Tax=Schizosaccharomyces japonicus (strain yFS275 / FY16936) TaxID=402676 RepID=B6K6J2_SCHJY|nr:acetyl-CoA transporter [Schizosaccharomyces japonicus yFS275]EEB09146.1 acetyl-CoA transporter [Schizosaccharomyces japonicus yFS275]